MSSNACRNTTRTYASRSCAPPKVTFEQPRCHNHLSVGIVVFITSSFNFHDEHSNSSSALLGNSWTAAVSTSLRLTLRDNQAFLKSAGLILPPQSNSQTVQFGNEDASLLFRASHHASTSISANQKALDAPDLGYCEFLEFLCRLSLAPNFKMLGDTTDEMRMQKLCNVTSRICCNCAFVPPPTSADIVPPLTHEFLIRYSSRGLMTKLRAQTMPLRAAGSAPPTALQYVCDIPALKMCNNLNMYPPFASCSMIFTVCSSRIQRLRTPIPNFYTPTLTRRGCWE